MIRVEMKALVVIAAAIALGVGAVWQPYDPDAVDLLARHAGPSAAHLLGTDHLGRDLLSRVMVGGWRTMIVILLVTGIGFAGGAALGAAAALAGGLVERLILRGVETFIVVPTLIVAMAAGAVFGLTPLTAGLAMGAAAIGPYALLSHALTRRVAAEPFVLASRALGVGPGGLIVRHIAPNLAPLLLTQAGANAGLTVVANASLAFLGLGADPSQADWGTMLFEYRLFMFDDPRLMLCPGLGVALTALALNLALDPAAGESGAYRSASLRTTMNSEIGPREA